jgi:hypothetical protein
MRIYSNNKILILINDHSILSHIIVPFFNKLNFLTKKELDYKDRKNERLCR